VFPCPACDPARCTRRMARGGINLHTEQREQEPYHSGLAVMVLGTFTQIGAKWAKGDRKNCTNRESTAHLLDHLVAWKSMVGGMVRPRALAVLRWMISSNLVGYSTGGGRELGQLLQFAVGTAVLHTDGLFLHGAKRLQDSGEASMAVDSAAREL